MTSAGSEWHYPTTGAAVEWLLRGCTWRHKAPNRRIQKQSNDFCRVYMTPLGRQTVVWPLSEVPTVGMPAGCKWHQGTRARKWKQGCKWQPKSTDAAVEWLLLRCTWRRKASLKESVPQMNSRMTSVQKVMAVEWLLLGCIWHRKHHCRNMSSLEHIQWTHIYVDNIYDLIHWIYISRGYRRNS